jgi:putative ABC transport system substrate-binding protein
MATRRAFISGLAASALVGACAMPGTARPSPRLRRIGWLSGNATESVKNLSHPFFERLSELTYVEGRDFAVEWGIADTKNELLPEIAANLVALPVDVIVAEAQLAQAAARDATKTVPIVFVTSTDPVGEGLVASLAHPGGNITGVTTGSIPASAKRVEVLKETVPNIARLAIVWNGNQPSMTRTLVPASDAAARTLGIEAKSFAVRDLAELDLTLEAIARERFDAMVTLPALSVFRDQLGRIPDFANKRGLPQAYADDDVVRTGGGLMSLNSNRPIYYRRAADYVDKIFNGARPADLPIEEPTKFDLIINLTAAQKLGLTIPQSVLAGATELIH